MQEGLIAGLKMQESFYLNSISCLTEEDSNFKPKDEMYTVAQQIAHTAESVDWLMEGAFGEKFDMDNFENYAERISKFKSLKESVDFFKESIERAIEKIKNASNAELMQPIKDPMWKGAPKMSIVNSVTDHTAHHRGALTVYSRMLGKVPEMPYQGM